ncbi:MAG TPA: gliding motility protein GldC [Parafilimonas sp.]|nr:gliding motility protein GldC [Parafilimonas sp.]
MEHSTITIKVNLDENKIPQQIEWNATGTTSQRTQQAKGLMLAFWDGAEKTAMRIDLWTKEMMVDEMADFFYQTLITMADTYNRATRHQDLTDEMKAFAKSFYQKFRDKQLQENR